MNVYVLEFVSNQNGRTEKLIELKKEIEKKMKYRERIIKLGHIYRLITFFLKPYMVSAMMRIMKI